MFQPNRVLRTRYYASNKQSQETLVDFGVIPDEVDERSDWRSEVARFTRGIIAGDFQLEEAGIDGDLGVCPLFRVRIRSGQTQDVVPADLCTLQNLVQNLCLPGQTQVVREHVLEIHVLGDN